MTTSLDRRTKRIKARIKRKKRGEGITIFGFPISSTDKLPPDTGERGPNGEIMVFGDLSRYVKKEGA